MSKVKLIFPFLSIESLALHFDYTLANVVWKESTCKGHWGSWGGSEPQRSRLLPKVFGGLQWNLVCMISIRCRIIIHTSYVVQFTVCRVTYHTFGYTLARVFLVYFIYKTKEINTNTHIGMCVLIFLKCTVSLSMSLNEFSSLMFCFCYKMTILF